MNEHAYKIMRDAIKMLADEPEPVDVLASYYTMKEYRRFAKLTLANVVELEKFSDKEQQVQS